MKTCIFCDVWGSAAHPQSREKDLREQIILHREKIRARHKAQSFLVYFQAYTNTFTRTRELQQWIETALSESDIKGVVIGTRPDCLSATTLDYFHELSKRTFVSIELGVQSFEDRHLHFMRRGHSAKKSISAIERISQYPEIDLGVHLMFGWPGEDRREVINAAEICSSLPIHNVKLHNLHVLKDTPLADLYQSGDFQPISLEDYSQLVRSFLTHLRSDIAVHRLSAVASRWDELVAPQWASYKMRSTQFIISEMKQHQEVQGMHCANPRTHFCTEKVPTSLHTSPFFND